MIRTKKRYLTFGLNNSVLGGVVGATLVQYSMLLDMPTTAVLIHKVLMQVVYAPLGVAQNSYIIDPDNKMMCNFSYLGAPNPNVLNSVPHVGAGSVSDTSYGGIILPINSQQEIELAVNSQSTCFFNFQFQPNAVFAAADRYNFVGMLEYSE